MPVDVLAVKPNIIWNIYIVYTIPAWIKDSLFSLCLCARDPGFHERVGCLEAAS